MGRRWVVHLPTIGRCLASIHASQQIPRHGGIGACPSYVEGASAPSTVNLDEIVAVSVSVSESMAINPTAAIPRAHSTDRCRRFLPTRDQRVATGSPSCDQILERPPTDSFVTRRLIRPMIEILIHPHARNPTSTLIEIRARKRSPIESARARRTPRSTKPKTGDTAALGTRGRSMHPTRPTATSSRYRRLSTSRTRPRPCATRARRHPVGTCSSTYIVQ